MQNCLVLWAGLPTDRLGIWQPQGYLRPGNETPGRGKFVPPFLYFLKSLVHKIAPGAFTCPNGIGSLNILKTKKTNERNSDQEVEAVATRDSATAAPDNGIYARLLLPLDMKEASRVGKAWAYGENDCKVSESRRVCCCIFLSFLRIT